MRVKLDFFGACWMSQPHSRWACMLPPMQVNLMAGRCEHKGCSITAWYGYQEENSRFCNGLTLPGVVVSDRQSLALIAACACSMSSEPGSSCTPSAPGKLCVPQHKYWVAASASSWSPAPEERRASRLCHPHATL